MSEKSYSLTVCQKTVPFVSAKGLKEAVGQILKEGKPYGQYIEHDNTLVVFGATSTGPMVAASIYPDIVQYETCLVVSIEGTQCYFLVLKDKTVIDEVFIDTVDPSPAEVLKLNIIFNRLGASPVILSNIAPDEGPELKFAGEVTLPFPGENVIVIPKLSEIFTAQNLVQAEELKKLAFQGHPLKKRFYYSVAVGALAVVLVFTDIMLQQADKEAVTTAVARDISERITNKQNAQTPDFSVLADWYTKTSVRPLPVLREVNKAMRRAQLIDGWEIHEVEAKRLKNSIVALSLKLKEEAGGNFAHLTSFANAHQWQITFENNIATLIKPISTEPLFRNYARFHTGSFEKYITDATKDWWDNPNIEISDFNPEASDAQASENDIEDEVPVRTGPKGLSERLISLQIDDFTAFDVASIGALLDGYPYAFEKILLSREGKNSPSKRRSEREENSNQSPGDFPGYTATMSFTIAGVTSR
ncbi:hypothetical protein [Alteromonas antoniana]|uniref:hypothetical protein n=1 Tax=Alteromonas antoniana TaxID=2803813 RepID=UPI001C48CD1D|nr:hypothetical protein [Alteromonas antoniana]